MKSETPITTLLFDWDGTLVDSASQGLSAFQKTFAELGVQFDLDIYAAKYSPNWYQTYLALGLPKEKWEQADDLWVRHYDCESSPLVEGASETILDLQRKGYRLGVVSSGNQHRVSREIGESGFSSVFEVVICHEDIVNRKPHPEGLEKALLILSSQPEQSCYVGDTPEDIQMGKSAGMFTVGVRSAYPSSTRLVSEEPDVYLNALVELSNHF
jgi:HAD superfamily hydrolase (TIGR01509 family)